MKEQLKKLKEVFRWISMAGCIPVVIFGNILHMLEIALVFFTIQIISFIIMFIIGWEYE